MRIKVKVFSIAALFLLTSCADRSSDPKASTEPNSQFNPLPTIVVQSSPQTQKTEPTKAIESAIAQNLFLQTNIPINAVNCPNQATLEAGSTFDCQVAIAGGTFLTTVTMKPAERFSLKTKQLIVLSRVEDLLEQAIKDGKQFEVKVDCGTAVKFFQAPGERFDCKLTEKAGKTGTATFTITDLEGNVDVKWTL
jgi:hypothetical protein